MSGTTCKFIRTVCNLRVIALFTLLLVALMALSQTKTAQQGAGKASLFAQQSAHLLWAGRGPAHVGEGRAPKKVRANDAMPENALLILVATYDSGGCCADAVAVADVNNDGKLDLVAANEGGTVGVLLGNGDGTFQPAATYDAGGLQTVSLAVADVNADGKPDIVVGIFWNLEQTHGLVNVLLGRGDGSFLSPVSYDSGGFAPVSIAIVDVNRDHKADLVVTNCAPSGQGGGCPAGGGQQVVGVLLGNGNGTFQVPVVYATGGTWITGGAVADLNGDGKLDVVTVSKCTIAINGTCPEGGLIGVLLGNGDGTFQSVVTYSGGGANLRSVAVGDMNGDGKPDVLVGADQPFVGVLLGNGDGTLQPSSGYFSNGGYSSVRIADVDGDGKNDVIASNCSGTCTTWLVTVLPGKGDGTFPTALSYDSGGWNPSPVAVADVNADGRPDVAVANFSCNADPTKCTSNAGVVGILFNNTGPHIPTTTSLVSSLNPVSVGKPVTYTATVASQSGGTVTGTVTFQRTNPFSTIGTVNVTGNQAMITTTFKQMGAYSITAIYSGDFYNSDSTSPTLTQYVQTSTKTVVTTSGSPSHVGNPVTFTATVISKHVQVPDGELVKFFDSTKLLGSVHLSGGMAAFTTSSLSVGTHTIKATYVGDLLLKKSTGKVFQTVEP